MKASIVIATAGPDFTKDQLDIVRRVRNVLQAHNLSVFIKMPASKARPVKLKKVS